MDVNTLLTRILKILAAIVLIGLALCLVGIEIGASREGLHHTPATWHFHAGAGIVICFCVIATYLLLRPAKNPLAHVYCERCHALGGHTDVTRYKRSVSHVGFHFGGMLLSIFRAESRKRKFRCRECETTFETHTTTSRAYQILYFLMILLVVNSLWSEIADFWTD